MLVDVINAYQSGNTIKTELAALNAALGVIDDFQSLSESEVKNAFKRALVLQGKRSTHLPAHHYFYVENGFLKAFDTDTGNTFFVARAEVELAESQLFTPVYATALTDLGVMANIAYVNNALMVITALRPWWKISARLG